MQDGHLCCPLTFSLAPQWPSHFFISRIATGSQGGARGETPLNFFVPLEKCVGDSLIKLSLKILGPSQKTFRHT